ncbi:MAG TPA: ABC transporter permease [Chloroflexota bacterium]|nr:ABC transporter permease [Chloroflexota bacterium]
MTPLLAAEWLKLRKRWMARILALIMYAIIALLFWGIGASNERVNAIMPRAWLTALFAAAIYVAPFIWPILAGSWAGSEYSWGTVRMILSRRPTRSQFVLAGIAVNLLAVGIALLGSLVVATVAGVVVAVLTGNPIVDTTGLDAGFAVTVVKMFLATWYILAFYVVLAFAAGTVFRSGAVGIGVGLGLNLAELILTGIFTALGGFWESMARHFPTIYTAALTVRIISGAVTRHFIHADSTTPGIPESLVAMTIYIAVPLALSLILVRTRDVTA